MLELLAGLQVPLRGDGLAFGLWGSVSGLRQRPAVSGRAIAECIDATVVRTVPGLRNRLPWPGVQHARRCVGVRVLAPQFGPAWLLGPCSGSERLTPGLPMCSQQLSPRPT